MNIPEGHVDSDVPPVLAGETVLVSVNETIHALATAGGSERWNTRDGPNAKHPPTVANGRVFVVENNPNRVAALDLASGETRWTFTDAPGDVDCSPSYIPDVLYVLDDSRNIIALEASTGEIHAQAELSIRASFVNVHRLAITPVGIFTRSDPTEGQSEMLVRSFSE
jgi:outer membrane protein assembly factor BamB